jgi:hypothetical protein
VQASAGKQLAPSGDAAQIRVWIFFFSYALLTARSGKPTTVQPSKAKAHFSRIKRDKV